MPAVRALTDAETSHKLAVELLSLGAWARPKDKGTDGESVRAEMWGKEVVNPVGVAAGFDKDARAIDGESMKRLCVLSENVEVRLASSNAWYDA